MNTFKKTIISAMLAFGTTAMAGDSTLNFGDWSTYPGKHTSEEKFYLSLSESTNSDIAVNVMYSTSAKCEPVIRVLIPMESENTAADDGPGQIGKSGDGMKLRVDKMQLHEYTEGYYNHSDKLIMITLGPNRDLVAEMFKGETLRLKAGTTISTFSLKGVKESNKMSLKSCMEVLPEMADKKPETKDNNKYFEEIEGDSRWF